MMKHRWRSKSSSRIYISGLMFRSSYVFMSGNRGKKKGEEEEEVWCSLFNSSEDVSFWEDGKYLLLHGVCCLEHPFLQERCHVYLGGQSTGCRNGGAASRKSSVFQQTITQKHKHSNQRRWEWRTMCRIIKWDWKNMSRFYKFQFSLLHNQLINRPATWILRNYIQPKQSPYGCDKITDYYKSPIPKFDHG